MDRRAVGLAVGLAGAPVVWSLVVAGVTPSDGLLRAWSGGAIVPGRLGAEPWRVLLGPLLNLDAGHLVPVAALLAALGYGVAAQRGVARAGAAAAAGAVVGGFAAAWAAEGWALGGSGALFGLVGAWVMGRASARWTWLAAAALWALWGPGSWAAHVGGLAAGVGVGALPEAARGGLRVAAVVAAVAWGVAAAIGGARLAGDGSSDWVAMQAGAGRVTVPVGWTPGVPVAPCRAAVTDGLLSVCALEAADRAAVEAALVAAAHTVTGGSGDGEGFVVTARPPGVGVVEVRRAPGGPTVMVHAVSAAAGAHRAAQIEAIVKLSVGSPSAGRLGR